MSYVIRPRTRFKATVYFMAEVSATTQGIDTEHRDVNETQLGCINYDDLPEEALHDLLLALSKFAETHARRTADTRKAIRKIDRAVAKARSKQ